MDNDYNYDADSLESDTEEFPEKYILRNDDVIEENNNHNYEYSRGITEECETVIKSNYYVNENNNHRDGSMLQGGGCKTAQPPGQEPSSVASEPPVPSVPDQPYLDHTLINQFHHDTIADKHLSFHKGLDSSHPCRPSFKLNEVCVNPLFEDAHHQQINTVQYIPVIHSHKHDHSEHIHPVDNSFQRCSSEDLMKNYCFSDDGFEKLPLELENNPELTLSSRECNTGAATCMSATSCHEETPVMENAASKHRPIHFHTALHQDSNLSHELFQKHRGNQSTVPTPWCGGLRLAAGGSNVHCVPDVSQELAPSPGCELSSPEEAFYDAVECADLWDKPLSLAKLKATLSWILHKAYKSSIPEEFKNPFYETDQGPCQLKHHLIRVLASSEVYCLACANMFPNTSSKWQGHWNIIQVLSRKGIYVTGPNETAVTETILMKTAPFNVDAHLSLMNALLLAYASEMATVERVVQAVRRLTSFNASSELPSGVEECLVFWLNKVCAVALSRDSKSRQMLQGETNQKVRIVSQSAMADSVSSLHINNIMGDITDGCSLSVLISFYCPTSLTFSEICLKDSIGIADSLYNLRLVKTFCERHLPAGCFPFTYEDILYTPQSLKENILAFIGELFYWFEIQKFDGSRSSSSAVNGVPQVSNATKRSFHKNDDSRLANNTELNNSASILPRQGPLLPKRHQEEPVRYLGPPRHPRRPHSLSSPQDREVIKQSLIAWEDNSGTLPVSQSQESYSSALLANVSIDSQLNESFTDDQLGSINFDSDISQSPQPTVVDRQESVQSNLRDPSHPDFMEVESVNSRQSNTNTSRSEKLEPLMPAILRPAKEKVSNHTKSQERGEPGHRKKTASPTKPRKSRSSPVSSTVISSQGGDICIEAVVTLPSDVVSSDETIVTPIPDDQLSTCSVEGDGDTPDSQKKGFDAFFINPDISVEVSLPPVSSQSPRAWSAGSHSDESDVAASYTVGQTHTLESARIAGIPVVQSSENIIQRTTSRDGSVSSSRSSGDFSDHESHKIHLDHKLRETAELKNSLCIPPRSRQSPDVVESEKPELVITDPLPQTAGGKRLLTTNFAEIKRIKDTYGNIDNSGLVYMQNGQEKGTGSAGSLKSAFLRKQNEPGGKKTSFATLPNETTWSARASQSSAAQGQSNGSGSVRPAVSGELAQLRIRLDEKRKEIEKKKQRIDVQQQKMRQRLGKAAFMRVVSRHMDDGGSSAEASPPERTKGEIDERLGHVSPSSDPHRPTSLMDTLLSASQRSRAFSREGIQQTIDNVRKKWFKEDDLVGGERPPDDESMTRSQEDRSGSIPNMHQSSSHPMTDSQHSTSSQHSTGSQPESYEAYDSSLDRLNKNLTDLQGEIARLSLQQEQIKFLQSPQGYTQADMQKDDHGQSMTKVSSVPPHPVPQTDYPSSARPVAHGGLGEPHQPYLMQPPHTSTSQFMPDSISKGRPAAPVNQMYGVQTTPHPQPVPYSTPKHPSETLPYSSPIMSATSYQPVPQSQPAPVYLPHPQPLSSTQHSLPTVTSQPSLPTEKRVPTPPGYTLPPHSPDAPPSVDTTSEDSSSTQDTANGFFVSFGDETPKRSKPKLGKDRPKKTDTKSESTPVQPAPVQPAPVQSTPVQPAPVQSTPVQPAPVQSTPVPAASVNTSAATRPSPSTQTESSSPKTGFVIDDVDSPQTSQSEEELARKKERIRLMQLKRKEEQEKKRLEKEQETIKQREAQRLKQEEAEQKKAEDKTRREQIYQQYLLRKQKDDDEVRVKVEKPPERPTKAKPRPKSMFIKASNSPPQDDEASTSTSVHPKRKIPYKSGKLRKAVSCNTLTQNGRPGGATYRRPPSPDLYRLRGNPGSDSGSNAGTDYSGPKLFVKPSSKSNRNLISNAISHCCLAGCVNNDPKNKVLEIISQSEAKHFLILFRDGGCQFKGLYTYVPEIEEILKIYGVGPKQLTNKMVERFYKYNSGTKSFAEVVSTKHMSVSIDAVVLHNALWKTGKGSATKK